MTAFSVRPSPAAARIPRSGFSQDHNVSENAAARGSALPPRHRVEVAGEGRPVVAADPFVGGPATRLSGLRGRGVAMERNLAPHAYARAVVPL